MTLVRTGGGVTNILGPFGGVYFTRDNSGLHCSSKPRRVHQQTTAQKLQRDAFIKARAACLAAASTVIPKNQLNRWVSYYMYRAMNGLPFIFDAIVTGDPVPDCTGTYELGGTYDGKNYYKRKDSAYYLWYRSEVDYWVLDDGFIDHPVYIWRHKSTLEGTYVPLHPATGNPIVKIELRPPPLDYQIPKL
ncbi:hypothetical protein ES703_63461 [subsurface metagenome]